MMIEYYKTTIELDKVAVDEFKLIFPSRGMLKFFLNLSLKKFNELHDHTVLDGEVSEAVESAAAEMNDYVEDEDEG